MPTAFLFPGQGSQTDDMRELAASRAPELVELVEREVGVDPFARAEDGTAYAQPAILCASLAAFSASGRRAQVYAGHSLGELSALAAAGALEPADAIHLAAVRGRLMQDAIGSVPGGMMAVLGDADAGRALALDAGIAIANDNGPTQIVVAGPREGLATAEREAKGRGLRTIRLSVSGAFHTEAVAKAVAPFRAALGFVAIEPPSVPVYSSSAARPFPTDPDRIRDQLAAAIARPVRWRETLEELHLLGVRSFVEVGPGKALTRMARRAFDDVDADVLEVEEPAHA
jgi:malonyl CoA-acyl carrier protein transacylase